MKKILITGGAGFIGSHLAKKLSQIGYAPVITDRLSGNNIKLKQDRLNKFLNPDEYIFYNSELSDYKEIEKIFHSHKFDVICHFAAKTNLIFNPESYGKNNVESTTNIFELAKKFNVPKIVFATTGMVYGNNSKIPFNEKDNTDRPLSLYAATKKSNEILAYTYHYLYKIQMVGLRFFTTYGPWGRVDTSINKFTEKILKDEEIEIHTSGKIERDYTYIDDIIDGIIASIEKNFSYELINLGSGKSIELEKIINLIEHKLGKQAKKKYMPMYEGDLSATWADIEKAKKLLDYEPKISIEEGIEKFVDWYKGYYTNLHE
ncbi:GDP-mannose 4,6-dehydratase [Patescibacteria group bacterium]